MRGRLAHFRSNLPGRGPGCLRVEERLDRIEVDPDCDGPERIHPRALEACAHRRRQGRRGVQDAGVPVDVFWKSPIREDDREQQVQVVEGFISQRVNGMVLAPLDSHALLRPVEEAGQAGIPTVIFDSALADPCQGDQLRLDGQRQGRTPRRQSDGRAPAGQGPRAHPAISGGIGRPPKSARRDSSTRLKAEVPRDHDCLGRSVPPVRRATPPRRRQRIC